MHSRFCNCNELYFMCTLKFLVKFYGNAWEASDAEWCLIKPDTRLLQHLKIIYFYFHEAFSVVRIQSDCGQLFHSS